MRPHHGERLPGCFDARPEIVLYEREADARGTVPPHQTGESPSDGRWIADHHELLEQLIGDERPSGSGVAFSHGLGCGSHIFSSEVDSISNCRGGVQERPDHLGSMTFELLPPDQRTVRNKAFIQAWRQRIVPPPGLENLTKDKSTVLLHFENGVTETWTLLRMDESAAKEAVAEYDSNSKLE
ncbi:MAG: hypothetical protein ACE5GB_11475 [Acidimicrobiales bacterium]